MVLARFLPRDEQFFDFFRDGATNAAEVAAVLAEVVELGEGIERQVRRLRDLEHRGDEITHQIFHALNSTFVTPFDRGDIRDLASAFDDFLDFIEEIGRRLYLFRIEQTTEKAHLLARIIGEQAQLLAEAIPLLEEAKQHDQLLRIIVDIHRLENEGDEVLSQVMAGIYDDATDIPSLIKAMRWNELYQQLEDTTDRAEDVANTLEGIVLKHA